MTEMALAEWIQALGGKVEMPGGRLKVVSLASTGIGGAQLTYLASATGIEELNLEATEAGDLGLESV